MLLCSDSDPTAKYHLLNSRISYLILPTHFSCMLDITLIDKCKAFDVDSDSYTVC